jgi:hypothetical protein
MLLNGAAQIEKTPQFALLHSVTCVQLGLITLLGNSGCVALRLPVSLVCPHPNVEHDAYI